MTMNIVMIMMMMMMMMMMMTKIIFLSGMKVIKNAKFKKPQ